MKTMASTQKDIFNSWTPFFLLIHPGTCCKGMAIVIPLLFTPALLCPVPVLNAPVSGDTSMPPPMYPLQTPSKDNKPSAEGSGSFHKNYSCCDCARLSLLVEALWKKKPPHATEKPLICAARGEPSPQGSLSRVFTLSWHKLISSSVQLISLSSAF